MTVTLASRISAVLLAGTIVVASWSHTVATPAPVDSMAPVVATR